MAECIDRQALLRYLNDIWLTATPNDSMPDDDRHLAMVRCMGLNDAMDAVKSIPAADVRPSVKAHFKLVDGYSITALGYDIKGLECSNCGATFIAQSWVKRFNFCPNCGADMREES